MRACLQAVLCWATLLATATTLVADEQAVTDLKVSTTPVQSPNQNAKVAKEQGWVSMFDGQTLKGWEPAKGIDYEQRGEVTVRNKWLVLETGQPGTGVRWTGKFPKIDYEVKFEASRLEGNDFFCGFTFPVGDGSVTLVLGGWSGTVVGLSNIDGYSAVENETTQGFDFKNGQWYRVHVKVTTKKVQVWLDDEQIIDFEPEGRKLSVRWEVEACLPFGFATWQTTGGLRDICYRTPSVDQDKVTPQK